MYCILIIRLNSACTKALHVVSRRQTVTIATKQHKTTLMVIFRQGCIFLSQLTMYVES